MSKSIETFYGVNPSQTCDAAILWQYNNSTNLQSLISSKEVWRNNAVNQFWCWYFFGYFTLANDYVDADGITIWSIILNYPVSANQTPNQTDVWGFGADDVTFDQGGFGINSDSVVSLPIEYSRITLLLRYFQLTTSATVPQINAFMIYLLKTTGIGGNGKTIVVVDNHDMTITYRLNFEPDQYLRFILDNTDVFPRPSGVAVDWQVLNPESWGFGIDDYTFDNAPFGE